MLRVVTLLSAWLLFNVVGRAVADGASAPLADQHLVAHLERSLFGELPSAWLQSVAQAIPSGEALEASLTAVYLSIFAVPIVMAAITATAPVAVFRVAALSSALCLLIGLACFALLPTSPPWPAEPHEVSRTTPHLLSNALGFDVLDDQDHQAVSGYSFEANDLAAMPSIHVGATVLLALTVASKWSRARGVVWVYPTTMTIAVVYLGEHYVLDAVAGWIVAIVGWSSALALLGHRRSRQAVASPSAAQVAHCRSAGERRQDHGERDQRGSRRRIRPDLGRLIGEGPVQRPPPREAEMSR